VPLGSMSDEELTSPRTFSEHDPESRWSSADDFVHTTLIEQNWNPMFRRHVAGNADHGRMHFAWAEEDPVSAAETA
jgi:hypothetical protein